MITLLYYIYIYFLPVINSFQIQLPDGQNFVISFQDNELKSLISDIHQEWINSSILTNANCNSLGDSWMEDLSDVRNCSSHTSLADLNSNLISYKLCSSPVSNVTKILFDCKNQGYQNIGSRQATCGRFIQNPNRIITNSKNKTTTQANLFLTTTESTFPHHFSPHNITINFHQNNSPPVCQNIYQKFISGNKTFDQDTTKTLNKIANSVNHFGICFVVVAAITAFIVTISIIYMLVSQHCKLDRQDDEMTKLQKKNNKMEQFLAAQATLETEPGKSQKLSENPEMDLGVYGSQATEEKLDQRVDDFYEAINQA